MARERSPNRDKARKLYLKAKGNIKLIDIATQLDKYENELQKECISINSKMETEYKKLSALSHSLILESQKNTFSYFSDMAKINEDNMKIVLEKINNIEKHIS